ncbi:MAG: Gfo/Idh/MocA family oxidoreductase [Bacteroidota bacterium]
MDRRNFMIKSTLASAALGGTTSVMAKMMPGMSASDTIRIGIVGSGDRGSGLIPHINKLKGLEVVACCDIIPFRLEAAIAKTDGKAKGYKDYRKLLDDQSIDAVLVATPFSTHSEIAIDVLDAGKHLYCEKTLAKGYDGIQNLVNKAKASKKIVQTGHQYHSSRLYTHAVDLINSGKIGKVTAIDCTWNRNGDWRRPVPSPELERAINWRMYREYSGGLVAELCSHQLDFSNWVMDTTPEKVVGSGGVDYWKDGRETYDNVHLIYTYPNGVRAKFTSLTSNAMDGYRVRVMGDKGSLVLGFSKAWFYPEGSYKKELGNVDGVAGATVKWDQGKGIPIEVEHADPSAQALMDFRDSILKSVPPTSDITTGAKAAVCVQMGLEAMYNETIVSWKQDLNI